MSRLLFFIQANWIAFTLTALTAITVLSLWPLDALPPVPGTDKIHHMIAYAFLTIPTALRKPKGWVLYGLFFIAYSGAVELLQPLVNRYGEWLDMAANTAGVVSGLLVAAILKSLFPPMSYRSRY